MTWLIGLLFALLGLLCLLLVVLGLPGAWLMLGLAFLLEWGARRIPGAPPEAFGWTALGAAFGLALLGELVELLAGVLGARRGGASRRGMWGAFLGGLVGGLVGTVAIPVPVVGTLAGALLGTFGGAWVGETTGPAARRADEAVRPALAATVGRVLGTAGKLAAATAAWVVLVAAILWPG